MSVDGKVTAMRAVAYYRVSTDKQGRSGLGLEAQREAVRRFLRDDYPPIKEFTEIESGKRADRPELQRAIQYAKVHKAKLVIAKLDRLARNVHFVSGLIQAGVDFVAADNPHANKLTIHIIAAVAEDEAQRTSERTKAALKAAKARGVKLGGFRGVKVDPSLGTEARQAKAVQRAETLRPTIEELRAAGFNSLHALAAQLNARGIPTARGKEWQAVSVSRLLQQLDG